MCGIAGYSLSTRSAVSRTLAAQSLLAGIAERGADAVGYAHRSPDGAYPVVTKQRTPASKLLERIDGLRCVDCGPLENSRTTESLTALLIGINARYKTHAGIKITGV